MCAPSWQLSDRRTRAKPSRMVVYESNHAGLGCAPPVAKAPLPVGRMVGSGTWRRSRVGAADWPDGWGIYPRWL